MGYSNAIVNITLEQGRYKLLIPSYDCYKNWQTKIINPPENSPKGHVILHNEKLFCDAECDQK